MDDVAQKPENIVLLTSATDASLPDAVVDAGRQRGVELTHVTSQPAVMVEMHRGATALIVIEAGKVPQLRELGAAMATYYPKVKWRHYKRQAPTANVTEEKNNSIPQIVNEQTIVAYQTDDVGESVSNNVESNIKNEMPEKIISGETLHERNNVTCIVTEEELDMLMKPFDEEFENDIEER